MSSSNPAPWSSSYRLVAAEKWKAKSAVLGNAVTEALVEYSHPLPGMLVLDLASGTGEPSEEGFSEGVSFDGPSVLRQHQRIVSSRGHGRTTISSTRVTYRRVMDAR